jgi:hypothetical protein
VIPGVRDRINVEDKNEVKNSNKGRIIHSKVKREPKKPS